MSETILYKKRVLQLLKDLESEQIERTISTVDTNKFAQAVCAFSNDLHNTSLNGYLFIGAHDNGKLTGLKATDKQLQSLGGLRSDGNILPQPIMSVKSFSFDEGDVIVIEVQPSPFPPVRYKGKTWIRVGARKAVANEMEERRLIERRSANISMFDIRPCMEASLEDMDLDLFRDKYIKNAIDVEVLKNDKREIKEQLAALRFYNTRFKCPTNAGILMFGKNPEYFIPGGYVQFVRFEGKSVAGNILNEKKFTGNLMGLLPRIDAFIDDALITQHPVPVSTLKEKTAKNYPNWAIRELMMNAIMHRDYESNAAIKFYQYKDRLEISNAGGLYGKARPENFPNENDYRNPTLAEAMKVLGYVNRFNRGISRVQEEMEGNGNPQATFQYNKPGAFSVTVIDALFGVGVYKKMLDNNISLVGEETEKIGGKTEKTRGKTEKTRGKTEKTRGKTEKTREKIIQLIKVNNTITTPELASKTNITEKGVEYHLGKLKSDKILMRVGAAKGGHWQIINQEIN